MLIPRLLFATKSGLIFTCDLIIALVNQVYYDLHHYILLLGAALGNHQCERYKGVVGNALGSVGTIEDSVVVEEP